MKKVTASQIKRLPAGTIVYVTTKDGNRAKMSIAPSYKKKVLKGVYKTIDIKDRAGWVYEVDD